MIVVRDVFQLKFGAAREAVAVWKEGLSIIEGLSPKGASYRLLTDLIGADYYTLVFESTYADMAEYERAGADVMGAKEWKEWYRRFVPLAVGGHREILNVVE